MSSDDSVLRAIDAVFGAVERPAQCYSDLSDLDAADHEKLLRSRDRETLTLEDVGNVGWDPFCDALPNAIAYFFPTLARLALGAPSHPFEWYAWQLLFHLTHRSQENPFYRYCSPDQKAAVAAFLAHIIQTRAALIDDFESSVEFTSALDLWRGLQS